MNKLIIWVIFLFQIQAFSQGTISWDGNLDGDGDNSSWNDPLNWNLDRIPNSEDDVYIGLFDSDVVISAGSVIEVRSLLLEGVELMNESSATLLIKPESTPGISLAFGTNQTCALYNHGSIEINSSSMGSNDHGISVSNDCVVVNESNAFIKISNVAGTNSSAIGVSGGHFNNQGLTEIFDTRDDSDIEMALGSSTFFNDGLIEVKNSFRMAEFSSFAGMIGGKGTFNIAKLTMAATVIDPGPYDPFFVQSPGQLTFDGDAEIKAGTRLKIDIRDIYGPGDPEGHDQLRVTGDLIIGDTLEVGFLNAYFPDSADYLNVITYGGTLTGTFAELNLPSPIMDHWNLDYGMTNPGKIILYNEFCTQGIFRNCLDDPCPLWSGHYKAGDKIQYTGGYFVPSGERVILDAATSTTFPMDFDVKAGAALEILTNGCSN